MHYHSGKSAGTTTRKGWSRSIRGTERRDMGCTKENRGTTEKEVHLTNHSASDSICGQRGKRRKIQIKRR